MEPLKKIIKFHSFGKNKKTDPGIIFLFFEKAIRKNQPQLNNKLIPKNFFRKTLIVSAQDHLVANDFYLIKQEVIDQINKLAGKELVADIKVKF